MNSDSINIAVCMYGQLRTGLYCAPWILETFNSLKYIPHKIYSKKTEAVPEYLTTKHLNANIDYFLHLKNYNVLMNTTDAPDYNPERPYDPVSNDELHQVIDFYKPKKFHISTFEEEVNICYGAKNTYSGMYSSINNALVMKKEYEVETGKTYDYVFVHRYDSLLGPQVTSLKHLIIEHGIPPWTIITSGPNYRWKWENERLGANDVFLGGDNFSIDMMLSNAMSLYSTDSDTFAFDEIGGPNIIGYKCITAANLNHFGNHSIIPAIVRPSADKIPVMDSWQYHQNYWVNNHKSKFL